MLVYAVGDDHALRDPARAVLDAAYHRRIAATTTVEVIQEFLHVRARRRTRADAAEHAAAYMRLLSPLVSVDEATLAAALEIFTTDDRVGRSARCWRRSCSGIRAVRSCPRIAPSLPSVG